jgi:hypothetical protein
MPAYHDPYRPTNLRDGDAPKAVEVTPEDEAKKVPSGTTKEILAWVDGDADRARQALEVEEAHDEPRKGVVKALNEIIAKED